ncbi:MULTISPECIES: TRAP transporter substrate-binding protein [Hyphomicrobiales]|uniref:TRAP transporter substrate-binding protein n=1 Tax=Hyphomicrobiales TaxID=356 RepID=UPI003514FD31
MKRRDFLTGAAVTGAAAATLAVAGCDSGQNTADCAPGTEPASPAIVTNKRKLKMVTTWQKNFPGLGTSAERVAKRIEEATDGQISIKVYAAGELVPAFECFDAVSNGTADCYNGAEYYWQGKSVGFSFFTAVPFGMTANELTAWIYHGGGQELWDELSARFNLKGFLSANTGVQMGGWFNKQITSLEDLKGLKIRMPGLGGEVMRRLGAAAVSLPGPDIYQALQTGAINATEWVGPWNDLAQGFYKVTKYYYWPGFHEPGAALATVFNKDVYESLTKGQQQIIQTVCHTEHDYTLAEFNQKNAGALDTLIKDHGVVLEKFPADVFAGMREASAAVLADVSQESEIAGRIYSSFKENLENSIRWTRISEEAYVNMRTANAG